MNFWKVGSKILVVIYILAVLTTPLAVKPYSSTKGMKMTLVAEKSKTTPIMTLIDFESSRKQIQLIKSKEVAKVPVIVAEKFEEPEVILSRGGSGLNMNVVAVLDNFEITWYNNDGISHTTKSGAPTIDGQTVSVDPKIIPLGTWIEICMPDGSVLKRKAEDTGGAVRGRILDVYADKPASELRVRGRTKHVTVRILRRE